MASDKTPEFQICDSMQVYTHVSHNHIGLCLPFLFPLSTLRVVRATQHLDGCLKWERIWRMRGTINRQTCPWLPFLTGLYLAVSVFSLMCTVSRYTYPSPWKENENPHTPYALTSTNVHMSQLLFLTLIPATLSLSLSRTHTNHAGSERCWGCNLSGIGLITA